MILMIQLIIEISESNGGGGIRITHDSGTATPLEIGVLAQQCEIGFQIHSGAVQKIAEVALNKLRSPQPAP